MTYVPESYVPSVFHVLYVVSTIHAAHTYPAVPRSVKCISQARCASGCSEMRATAKRRPLCLHICLSPPPPPSPFPSLFLCLSIHLSISVSTSILISLYLFSFSRNDNSPGNFEILASKIDPGYFPRIHLTSYRSTRACRELN